MLLSNVPKSPPYYAPVVPNCASLCPKCAVSLIVLLEYLILYVLLGYQHAVTVLLEYIDLLLVFPSPLAVNQLCFLFN